MHAYKGTGHLDNQQLANKQQLALLTASTTHHLRSQGTPYWEQVNNSVNATNAYPFVEFAPPPLCHRKHVARLELPGFVKLLGCFKVSLHALLALLQWAGRMHMTVTFHILSTSMGNRHHEWP